LEFPERRRLQIGDTSECNSALRFRAALKSRPHSEMRPSWLCWLFGFVLSAAIATAQPLPKINSISPDWIQRGTTVTVMVTGENLGSVTHLIISGDSGVTAEILAPPHPTVGVEPSGGGISTTAVKDEKKLSAKISISSDAALSDREVRLATATGVSNPLPLHVGHWPEIAEKGPNQTAEQAQPLELPVALTGRIGSAAETDYFRFTGKKDQLVVIDVYGSRLGSPIDPSLAVLDKSGKELARSEDVNGLDPLLAFKVPEDGEYVLEVRDFRYQGGETIRYRLLAGAVPYVYSVFPFGARSGQSVEVEVRGHNLAESKLTLRIDPTASVGRQDLRITTPLGISNPFPFDVAELSEFADKEPNNQADQANEVSLPVVINGRLQGDKDRDAFKFKAQKDQEFIFEVLANRFGSPLDALLTLQDSKGNVIERNDDAVGADARIQRKFAEAGEFVLIIEDLLGRSGSGFGYRLSIRPPQPDFLVRLFPDNPRLARGGHVPVRCELTRINGFNGSVRVAFTNLPDGVFCEPALFLPAAPGSVWLTLSAAENASLGTLPIKLAGTSAIDGKPVSHPVEPMSEDKPVKEGFLTVMEQPPFTLELASLSALLEQGQSAPVEVMAQRRNGFTGEIELSAEGFSAGREPITQSLSLPQTAIKANESRAALNLQARLDSEIGTRLILIKGEAAVEGQKITQYSRALPVTVQEIPFVLSTTLRRLSVTALPTSSESAAREAVFSVRAGRRAGFTNEIALALEGLPDGVTATIDKVPANASETTVKLVATEKAPVGKEFNLSIQGVGQFKDRTYRQKPGEIKLTINPPGEAAEVAATGTK
jgi:hypothetical protein